MFYIKPFEGGAMSAEITGLYAGAVKAFSEVSAKFNNGRDSSNRVYIVITKENNISFGNSNKKASFAEVTRVVEEILSDESVSLDKKMQILHSYEKISEGFKTKKFGFLTRYFYKSRIENLKTKSAAIISHAKKELLNSKVNAFKRHMAPGGYPFSKETKSMVKLYENYLNEGMTKEFLFLNIDHIKVSDLERNKVKQFVEREDRVEKFRNVLGGEDYKYSTTTTNLADLYRCYLQNIVRKDELTVAIKAREIPDECKNDILAFIDDQDAEIIENRNHPNIPSSTRVCSTPTPAKLTQAVKHTSTSDSIASIYKDKPQIRKAESAFIYKYMPAIGGAGTAANKIYELYKNLPDCKVGVMLAANSGQPGGKVGQELDKGQPITEEQLNYKVQEESVLANVLMTMCEGFADIQKSFIDGTIKGQWGMKDEYNPKDKNNNMTLQGHDFTKPVNLKNGETSATKYNEAYVVDGCRISSLQRAEEGKVRTGRKNCPVTLIFADSVNANPELGKPGGTMQRTFNPNAAADFDEFRSCVKNKLRAALDAAATAGVTIPLVAQLSGGIYAGPHADKIKSAYSAILVEVLSEPVGPNNEPRGSYFYDVIIPTLKR